MKVKLSEVSWGFTKNIAQKDLDNNNGCYPIYGASGYIKNINFYISDKPYIGIVKDGSGVGRVNIYPAYSSLLGTMQYVVPNDNMDIAYLMYALRYMKLGSLYSGAAIPHIYYKNYQRNELNYREKNEQKSISTQLTQIENAILVCNAKIIALDELVKSRFIEMFVEKGFKEITFSDYAEIIDGDRGKNYPKAEEFSDEGYCLFLSAKNVTKDGFLFEQMQFISEEKDNLLRKGKLCRGDIVITTRGTIGNIAFYDDIPYDNVRINSGMVIIRQKEVSFNQIFFLNAFKNKIDEIKETNVTGAAQPQLPIHIMSKIKLLNPPIELQNDFADFVKLIDKSKFIVQKQIDDLQELLDSKMDEYFG